MKNLFDKIFDNNENMNHTELIKRFTEVGELDITELYKNYKDLTIALLMIVSKYKKDIVIDIENDIKEEIEGFRHLLLNKVIIKYKGVKKNE